MSPDCPENVHIKTFLAYLVGYTALKILTSSPHANDDNHASEFEELFFSYIINRMFLLAWILNGGRPAMKLLSFFSQQIDIPIQVLLCSSYKNYWTLSKV